MIRRPAGVVVTYFPDAEFSRRLAAIALETSPLIVVDNSANPLVAAALETVCTRVEARLIRNAENVGLGAALTIACAALKPAGAEWMVAFDQDSTPEPGFSAALLRLADAGGGVPIVGANWQEEARGDFPSRHLGRHPWLPLWFTRRTAFKDLEDVTCVITSGTLLHLPTLETLGGFNEALFLDLVDTDVCLRARRAGHTIRVAAAAKLHHRRGAKRPVRLLGRTWWPAFMPPSRLFYLFRNRVWLLRLHAWDLPHWALFEVVHSAKILAEILWLEDDKVSKFRACARGVWRGLLEPCPRVG